MCVWWMLIDFTDRKFISSVEISARVVFLSYESFFSESSRCPYSVGGNDLLKDILLEYFTASIHSTRYSKLFEDVSSLYKLETILSFLRY